MTTRLSKVIDGAYLAQTVGTCKEPIQTFQECFAAAAATLGSDGHHVLLNQTGSDPTRPAGCSATVDKQEPLKINVFFNKASTSVKCTAGTSVTGTSESVVQVAVTVANRTDVQITMKGPSAVWFGAGFGAKAMSDAPWTVIVDGKGAVSERKLSNHAAGSILTPTVTVVSNTVNAAVRTVVVSRPLKGLYSFDFESADATVPFIAAVGSGPAYAYHKERAPSSLTLLPATVGACVCPQEPKPFGQAQGSLVYHNTGQTGDAGDGSVGFRAHKCADFPSTVLLQQKNPTCDIRAYRGGQWACHHMWSLLDADQPIPWPDQPLVFHHKYRFWVQPFDETYHKTLTLGETAGSALLIGSPWEFDVPKCSHGVPGCSLENGNWIHTISGGRIGSHTFTALNFHCHAPTCLSMEVYACEKGTAVPDCNATVGKLICREEPVYGGSSNPVLKGGRFDEPGYIAIPDCFWGDAQFGLEPPVNLTGVPLHMVKRSNATFGHYGEMAGGQPWVLK
jgi:hypothetical protein